MRKSSVAWNRKIFFEASKFKLRIKVLTTMLDPNPCPDSDSDFRFWNLNPPKNSVSRTWTQKPIQKSFLLFQNFSKKLDFLKQWVLNKMLLFLSSTLKLDGSWVYTVTTGNSTFTKASTKKKIRRRKPEQFQVFPYFFARWFEATELSIFTFINLKLFIAKLIFIFLIFIEDRDKEDSFAASIWWTTT